MFLRLAHGTRDALCVSRLPSAGWPLTKLICHQAVGPVHRTSSLVCRRLTKFVQVLLIRQRRNRRPPGDGGQGPLWGGLNESRRSFPVTRSMKWPHSSINYLGITRCRIDVRFVRSQEEGNVFLQGTQPQVTKHTPNNAWLSVCASCVCVMAQHITHRMCGFRAPGAVLSGLTGFNGVQSQRESPILTQTRP